jgi:hypothetical protein
MPRDVVLGEGYEGDVMVTPVHPGQHVGDYNVQDGSHSLLQRESGVGAPPHHHHGGGRRGRGGGWGWGPGYVPYEPLYIESVILDRSSDDDEDEKKKKRLKLRAMNGFGGLGAEETAECVNRIISAAAVGAREAIKGIESGVYNSLNDVCNHIRRRVCAEVQSHHAMYAKAVSEAVKSAFAEAKPHAESMLAGRPKGVSDFDDSDGLGGNVSSQADYNLLSKAQIRCNTIMAEISGIGKDEWDAIKNEEFEAAQWSPAENYSYDNMMGFWQNNMKSLILTKSHPVTVEQINEVNRLATGTDGLIALVKSHASPAAVAQGEADKAQTAAMLSKSGLVSPGSAGWDTFQKEVVDRAASLTSSGMGIATIAAIAFGLGTAVYLWARS